MAAPTYSFSPFATQRIPPAADRKASGLSPASPQFDRRAGRTSFAEIVRHAGDDAPGEPSDLSASGRHPHVHGEQHDDATSQAASSTVGGRLVHDADARRLGAAGPVAFDLGRLAGRLERGARDAGCVARNVEILAARLLREIPLRKPAEPLAGVTYAANQQAEHAQLLADAHAFVVRCAAQPKMAKILAALERGEDVVIVPAHDASVLFSAADNRPARAGVVGDDVNPTSGLPKLVSGFLRLISAGHRKSSSPAHQCAPASLRSPSTTEATDAWSTDVCETINRKVG